LQRKIFYAIKNNNPIGRIIPGIGVMVLFEGLRKQKRLGKIKRPST
jgi:hypothetical protein